MFRKPNCASIRRQRAWFVIVSLSALLALVAIPSGSVVWATPQQSPWRQTIPTLTPTPIPSWVWIGQAGANPLDYAPSGMPDFDQRQSEWRDPAPAGVWTHCGSVAVANVLWWLDSRSEPGSTPPPQVSDGCELVPSFGDWDDHDAQNVVPLVNDLATRLGTNQTGGARGTDVDMMLPALQTYLAEKSLQNAYKVTLTASPSFDQLLSWVQSGKGVVLLLGFWEWQGDRWVYLGAHYVAVAGIEPVNRYLALSDPFRDAWEAREAVLGRSPVSHLYPHDAEMHNDAQYVSHDAYHMLTAEGPG
ncbi:MAG: hypothetical protein FJ026_18640, partial [Chloroflexi bacterium]|nr:hypothetical protein [Chloroflexota bacterium]